MSVAGAGGTARAQEAAPVPPDAESAPAAAPAPRSMPRLSAAQAEQLRTVLRNAPSTALIQFVVACTEECYFDTYKDEIADLVDSWTIQEVRS